MNMKIFQYADETHKSKTAIIPVGAVEQHGPHLPITTDCLIAEIIASELANKLNAIVIPTVPVSCSHEHFPFGGTFSVKMPVVYSYIDSIIESVVERGFNEIIIVNGHGGNYFLGNLTQEQSSRGRIILLAPQRHHLEVAFSKAELESTLSEDMHAGEYETSILLSRMPECVRKNVMADEFSGQRPLFLSLGISAYSKTGVIGYPTKATAVKGEKILNALVDEISADLEKIRISKARKD